jgi:hypothetical protein
MTGTRFVILRIATAKETDFNTDKLKLENKYS